MVTLLHDGEMHVDFGWRTVVVFIIGVFVAVILIDILAGRVVKRLGRKQRSPKSTVRRKAAKF
jgi:hypothetical protein